MSNLPNDDQRLVDFLRQNRPEIPESNPELEEKLFQAIASSPPRDLRYHSPNHPSRYRQLWLVPPAIAASVALVFAGNYLQEKSLVTNSYQQNKIIGNYILAKNDSINHQELVKIENFLENNWSGVVTNNSPEMSGETIQNQYLTLAETKSHYPTKNIDLVTKRSEK